MTDLNEIDCALHQIRQMVLVGITASESLVGSESREGFFELPSEDSEMIAFALWNILDRVEALKAGLFAPKTVVVIAE